MGIAVGMMEALSKMIHSAYKNNRFRFVYLGGCHFYRIPVLHNYKNGNRLQFKKERH